MCLCKYNGDVSGIHIIYSVYIYIYISYTLCVYNVRVPFFLVNSSMNSMKRAMPQILRYVFVVSLGV